MSKGIESEFQKYIVIRFRCPVFNKRNHKSFKETAKYGPLKKKKSTEMVPEKDLVADILDGDFKICSKN